MRHRDSRDDAPLAGQATRLAGHTRVAAAESRALMVAAAESRVHVHVRELVLGRSSTC